MKDPFFDLGVGSEMAAGWIMNFCKKKMTKNIKIFISNFFQFLETNIPKYGSLVS